MQLATGYFLLFATRWQQRKDSPLVIDRVYLYFFPPVNQLSPNQATRSAQFYFSWPENSGWPAPASFAFSLIVSLSLALKESVCFPPCSSFFSYKLLFSDTSFNDVTLHSSPDHTSCTDRRARFSKTDSRPKTHQTLSTSYRSKCANLFNTQVPAKGGESGVEGRKGFRMLVRASFIIFVSGASARLFAFVSSARALRVAGRKQNPFFRILPGDLL